MPRRRSIARKQNRLTAAENARQERRRRHSALEWPIGEGVQLILGPAGEPHPTLHDDCPICQALREAGEPVLTLDEYGRLQLISDGGGGPWN